MKKCLVVDDQPINVQLLKRKLQREGYSLQSAYNGVEALELVKTDPPDLIVLDIMMPDMDGIEVCERLKADDATRDIPVIFVTARTTKEAMLEGLAAGAIDYIKKPIDLDEFVARVTAHDKAKARIDELKRGYDPDRTISKTISFRPEHKQAAISILSYFSTVLKSKYPNEKVQVSIEQIDDTVTLIVETEEGRKDKIQRALGEYGLVLAGQMAAEEMLPEKFEVLALKQKLELAAVELRMTQQLHLEFKGSQQQLLHTIQEEMQFLKQAIADGVSERIRLQGTIERMAAVTNDVDAVSLLNAIKDMLAGRQISLSEKEFTKIILSLKIRDDSLYKDVKDVGKKAVAGALEHIAQPWFVKLIHSLPF